MIHLDHLQKQPDQYQVTGNLFPSKEMKAMKRWTHWVLDLMEKINSLLLPNQVLSSAREMIKKKKSKKRKMIGERKRQRIKKIKKQKKKKIKKIKRIKRRRTRRIKKQKKPRRRKKRKIVKKLPKKAEKDAVAKSQTNAKSKLGAFFAHRHQVETQGVAPAKAAWVPTLNIDIVEPFVAYLEKYLDTIGLFRIPGSASAVDRIYATMQNPSTISLEEEDNPHNVAGTLKLYFRSLTVPLFPFELFDKAMEVANHYNQEPKVEYFKDFLTLIPAQNKEILTRLIGFLKALTKESEINKMDAENVGIVFGPTLLRQHPDKETPTSALTYSRSQSNFIAVLVEKYDELF